MQNFSTKKLQDRVLVKLSVFWVVFLNINSYKTSSRSLKRTCWSLFRWLLLRSFLSPPDCLQFQLRLNLVVLFSSFCMIFPSINLKWDIDRLAALLLWSLKHLSILNHCQQLQVDNCYFFLMIWNYIMYSFIKGRKIEIEKIPKISTSGRIFPDPLPLFKCLIILKYKFTFNNLTHNF